MLFIGTPLEEQALVHAMLCLLAGGQFFFAEVQPGVEVGEEPASGAALALQTGVGGSWAGSLPRFFLTMRYEHAGIENGASRRDYDDVAAGLRILIPVVEPLRIYGEALGGFTDAHATLARYNLPTLESVRMRPLVQLAAGVQVRFHTNFSVGARIAESWLDDSPDALALIGHTPIENTRTTLALVLGAHF